MSDFHINSTTIEVSGAYNVFKVYNVVVDVIRLTKVNTPLGLAESEETLVSNLSAHIKWKSGSEKIVFNKVTHYLDAVLKCRKPSGVTIATKDRIRYQGKSYEIIDVYDFNNLGTLLVMALRKIE